MISKDWLSEGVAIAAISVMAYMCAFSYECGFIGFFGISQDLMGPLDPVNIFIALGALFIVGSFIFFIANFIFMLKPKNMNAVHISIFKCLPIIVLFLILAFLYGKHWREWLSPGPVFIIIAIALLEFVFPLLTQRKVKGYKNKLESEIKSEKKKNTRTLLDLLKRRDAFIIIVILSAILISFHSGRATALKKENFLVLNDFPEKIIIRAYRDRIIAVSVDKIKKETTTNFVVFSLDSQEKLNIHFEKIGPLKLCKKEDRE